MKEQSNHVDAAGYLPLKYSLVEGGFVTKVLASLGFVEPFCFTKPLSDALFVVLHHAMVKKILQACAEGS